MTRLAFTALALDDLQRLGDFFFEKNPRAAGSVADDIAEALQILRAHPLVGRVVEKGFCELVISKGKTGYVALYRYDEAIDVALVFRLRHQKEVGFP